MIDSLQYISQGNLPEDHLVSIKQALDAGCTWIQLRIKAQPQAVVLPVAVAARQLCDRYKARLTINDHPAVAQEVAAYGLHLGLQDMPVKAARAIVGQEMIIGGTANTLEDVLQRVADGVDYIGLGPYRFTTTKQQLSPVLGLTGYQAILQAMQDRQIYTPVLAIGGIVPGDIPGLLQVGLHGVALSGVIAHSTDRMAMVRGLYDALSKRASIHA